MRRGDNGIKKVVVFGIKMQRQAFGLFYMVHSDLGGHTFCIAVAVFIIFSIIYYYY